MRTRDERQALLRATRLYVIVTLREQAGWLEAVRAALGSGEVGMVQLRDRGGDDERLLRRAAQLHAACAEHDALLILNDRPDLVGAARADGVHVGQDDAAPAEARRAIGADRILGLSTHGEDEVRLARGLPVDYLGLGPCYATRSKHLAREPGGPDLVRRGAAAAGPLPLFPIAGITTANAGALVEAGATRLAIGAGILAHEDPAGAARAFASMVRRGNRPTPEGGP
jgi:thiamine-phosphate pyrophosphorylase